MINISSRNKADIKENYDTLFNLVGKNSIIEACDSVDKLEMNLKKYCISRGENGNGGSKIFLDMKYALGHYTRSDWRRQEMYRLLEKLSEQISGSYAELPLKEGLAGIYDELKDDFKTACMTGLPRDMDSLTDDFIALQNLAPEIKKLGHDVYTGYDLMMRNAGKCQAALPRLMPQEKEAGRWVIKKEAINSLTTTFELLYSSVNQVLASLDQPEHEKKEEKRERASDLGEDQEKALKAEIRQLLYGSGTENGWPISEIARHKNMTVEEVVDILELEE